MGEILPIVAIIGAGLAIAGIGAFIGKAMGKKDKVG